MKTARKARYAAVLALTLLCLWHFGLRRYGLDLPMISDEGEYAYQARVLADGGVPYRDAYNQKPPVIFFLYRLAYGLFGQEVRSPRLLAGFFCVATMIMLFLLTPRDWPLGTRLVAPAVFGTLSTEPIGDMGFSANTEVFLAAFASLSALLLKIGWEKTRSRPWLLGAGAAMGLAFMTKQTAFWAAATFTAAIGYRDAQKAGWKTAVVSAGCFLAGCAAVCGLFVLYFFSKGAAGFFFDQAYGRNMDYASVMHFPPLVRHQLSLFFGTLLPAYLKGDWPVYLLVLAGLVSTRADPDRPWELLATLWLGAALVGAATGLFFFPHYFVQIYPPLALVAAMGAMRLRKKWTSSGVWLCAALCIYPVMVNARTYFIDPPERTARVLLYPNPLFESITVADYIRKNSSEQDLIYVFGSEPQIYVYSGRRAATRHIFVYPLTMFPRSEEYIDRELEDLSRAAPKFMIYVNQPASTLIASKLGDRFRRGVLELISTRYRWVGTVKAGRRGVQAAFWSDDERINAQPDWRDLKSLFIFKRKEGAALHGERLSLPIRIKRG